MPRVTGLFECLLEKAILGQTPRAWRVVIGPGKLVVGGLAGFFHEPALSDDHTAAAVERYMIALAGDAPSEAAVEPRPAAALGATDRPPPGRTTAGLDLGADRQDGGPLGVGVLACSSLEEPSLGR
jgi:hypothetical protein